MKYSKTQITFRTKNGFAFLSFPYRRKKDWPEQCLILTFGLERPVDHPDRKSTRLNSSHS